MKMTAMAANTPICDPVGGSAKKGHSLASSVLAASKITLNMASVYQNRIIGYCIEWERVVTSRVDEGIQETKELHERLLHYDNKVDGLRRTINRKEDSGKAVSSQLQEKLDRNEEKLEQAWKAFEKSAANLSNLLEQVTTKGWKELAPLVLNCIQWEVQRASKYFETFTMLPAVAQTLLETVKKASGPCADEDSTAVLAQVLPENQSAPSSETTGSNHSTPEDGNIADDPAESPMTPVPVK